MRLFSTCKKIPPAVLVGLALAVVLDTVIQIAWKSALAGCPDQGPMLSAVKAALKNPLFYLAMAALAAQLVNWTRVLARADLSFAQPVTALGYLTVLFFSHRLLHERLTAAKIGGIALILAGVYFISRTPCTTSPAVKRPDATGEPP